MSIVPSSSRSQFSRALFVALIALLPVLSSCGVGIWTRNVFGEELEMEVVVDGVVNDDNPVAMDLVYVYDEELLKTILQMNAKQWFEKKEQLQRDFPGTSGFESWEWEWVPEQTTQYASAPLRAGAIAGVLFVNYYNEGDHRVRLELFKDVRVKLGFADFTVEQM